MSDTANLPRAPKKAGKKRLKLHNPIDLKTFNDQAIIVRHCTRWWRALIPSAGARDLLTLIIDQTVGMGRLSFGFSYWMLEHGDTMTAGTRYSKKQLIRLVASLAKDKFITATPNADGIEITPNLERVAREYEQPIPHTPERTKVPTRRPKTAKKAALASTLWGPDHGQRGDIQVHAPETCMSTVETCMSPIRETSTEKQEKENQAYRHSPNAGAVVSLSSTVFAPARKRQRPSSTGPRAIPPVAPAPLPLHRDRLKPSAIEITFRRAFEDTFAGRPGAVFTSWTIRQKGKVRKSLIDTWKGAPQELHAFIQWSVEQWEYMIGSHFNWLRSPAPTLPSIDFLCARRLGFLSIFQRDGRELWLDSLSDREERRFHELTTTQGKTPEEARLDIAENRAVERLRKDMEKNEAQVRSAQRQVKTMEERMRHMRRIEPHPESEVAKQRAAEKLREELGLPPGLAPSEVPNFMQFVDQSFEDGLKD